MVTRRVALLMERLVGFNHQVLQGVRDYAGPSRGWVCHFIDPRPEYMDRVAGWEPHGVVAFLGNEEIAGTVRSLNVPTVDVAAWVDDSPFPRVRLDDVAIGRMAAEYLLSLGFENFAFIGNQSLAFSAARGQGYRQALAEVGYAPASFVADPRRFPTARGWTMGGVEGELVSWIEALPKPVAVFAENDERALLVSEACHAAGLDVPRDVAILGVDDDPYLCGLGYPPISSIATPARRLGFEAANLLGRLMEGFQAPRETLRLPPAGVVVRRSTETVAYGDPVVAQAVGFIHRMSDRGIAVEDVVAHVPVSRRTLERLFRSYVGRSILEEIARVRLERARLLLATTDLPLKTIATQTGFRTLAGFSTSHQVRFGIGPRDYRRTIRAQATPDPL